MKPQPSLQVDTSEKQDERKFTLGDDEWLDLAAFVVEFVLRGGNPALYTSKDGNALCLSLKSGKEGRRYWIGPDDSGFETIQQAAYEWGVKASPDNPVYLASERLTEEAARRLTEAGLEDD